MPRNTIWEIIRILWTIQDSIHYKDNYKDDSEQWKDIDLSFDEQNRITKAPYELTVDTDNYSITIKDKKTGQVSSLKLIKIGDKDIRNIGRRPLMYPKGKSSGIMWIPIWTCP